MSGVSSRLPKINFLSQFPNPHPHGDVGGECMGPRVIMNSNCIFCQAHLAEIVSKNTSYLSQNGSVGKGHNRNIFC